ncbi:MAG: dTDP-4-dehydrorhamnose reductase [Lachnospiraceae bacterium]|nr:dTDP-4-dehydrorhamnose reductase [Lachnospiraceae bacterium]
MRKLIVTGSGGQLGRAVKRQLDGRYDLIRTDVAADDEIRRLDITDIDAVTSFAKEEKPYAIINCAAYTAVDAQETDVDNSYRINAIGARNLAIAAEETGAKLVHISTDYVFAGDKQTPYTEFDAPGPISIYGKTKLAGENFVKEFSRAHFILRTAWLYGEGKNFVRTMLRLAESHDQLGIVDDQIGNPTSAQELARAIDYLLGTDNYGLFHATCEGVCSWADFAEEIFRLAGRKVEIERLSSEEYAARNPAAAPRPHFSHLEKMMFRLTGGFAMCDWHDAIVRYLESGVTAG